MAAFVFALSLAAVVPARADVLDENTRQRLAALKKLCVEGLVSPEVCQEKQRDILGLSRGPVAPARRVTSPPRAGAPATPSGWSGVETSSAPRDATSPPAARTYQSSLGFHMRLPAGWSAMSSQELQRRMAQVKTRMGDGPEAGRMPDLLGGDAEVFTKDGDQMVVLVAPDVMPRTAADAEELCRHISSWGAKLPGRPLQTYECGLRQVAGASALYIDQDGVIEGRRTLQVLLDTGAGRRLRFALTCRSGNVEARRAELNEVVASITR
jgi:hypothetical protein